MMAKEIGGKDSLRPIVIQGPMPVETDRLIKRLENVEVDKSGTFVFYKGMIDHYPVIVTKTGKGMINSAAATALAIDRYNPIAIINQGTAGGHDPDIHVFDIVLGKRTTNIGSLKTADLAENEGIHPTSWEPMDLMADEEDVEDSPQSEKIRYYEGDAGLLAAANAVKGTYIQGKVVEGVIGSSDVWNDEVDRLKWFREIFGTTVEEMEGAATAQISDAYHVPYLGIRIVSNNKISGEKYNETTADYNQDFVYQVVKKYISTIQNK